MAFEEYLRRLECTQTNRQRNRMHKHFLTLLESVKKHKTTKLASQENLSLVANISQSFCNPSKQIVDSIHAIFCWTHLFEQLKNACTFIHV